LTITELLHRAQQVLSGETGSEGDCRILLGHVLKLSAAQLISRGDHIVPGQSREEFLELVRRRQRGEPVAYLTGTREFWSLPIYVDNRVLVPRHETETVVECCILALQGQNSPKILELGTGSGAISIALSVEFPAATMVATDASAQALEVAAKNCESLATAAIRLVVANWFEGIGDEKFHLVCSNPPYIAIGDPHLASPGLEFEPVNALVSGNEGLDDLSVIVKGAASHLLTQGYLVVEHGFEQGEQVRSLFVNADFQQVKTHKDLGDNDRVTMGRLPG